MGKDAASAAPLDAEALAARIDSFLRAHPATLISEGGKLLIDLRDAQWTVAATNGRCTLQLWNAERTISRRVVAADERNGTLRLDVQRLGQAKPTRLELAGTRERRTVSTREAHRERFAQLLERVLARRWAEWKPTAFRTAMDLERSFGPAYARGLQVQGQRAWAVIAVNALESAAIVDGVLTLGVLWLHDCRERSRRQVVQGLRVVVPRGAAALTLARMAWLNHDAAQWELYELDEATEELTARELDDTGNLRTRLIHRPDETAARERFAAAVEQVLSLVPAGGASRVRTHLRSAAELVFLLHGLPFARARLQHTGRGFAQQVEITVGTGAHETPLTDSTRGPLTELLADLFARRRAEAANSARDPLYRAAPERWLESCVAEELAMLTRHLAPEPPSRSMVASTAHASDADDDARGNRADALGNRTDALGNRADAPQVSAAPHTGSHAPANIVPRLLPEHLHAQVPAIAGASDTGLLDLLGVTADGRLAVIELKAADDLHFAMQGLDYWIRVRAHQRDRSDATGALGEFQRAGYFQGVQLAEADPRLYLVAPALHIHPATETVLRYVSPRVEWHLVALDAAWRRHIRVVWRKRGGRHA